MSHSKAPPPKLWPKSSSAKDSEIEELKVLLTSARARVAFYEGFLDVLASQLEEPHKSRVENVLTRYRGEEK